MQEKLVMGRCWDAIAPNSLQNPNFSQSHGRRENEAPPRAIDPLCKNQRWTWLCQTENVNPLCVEWIDPRYFLSRLNPLHLCYRQSHNFIHCGVCCFKAVWTAILSTSTSCQISSLRRKRYQAIFWVFTCCMLIISVVPKIIRLELVVPKGPYDE